MSATHGAQPAVRVADVVERLLAPAASRPSETVDGLLAGSPEAIVTGIATTFLATQAVVERAAALGLNMVISHEGIFYSHHPDRAGLESDEVARTKRRRIEETGINIFRLHDHIHRYRPDAITEGLVSALGWSGREREVLPEATIVTIEELALGELAAAIKQRLGLASLRLAGELSMACRRIGVFSGYRGNGATAIPLLGSGKLDVVVAGEGPEWETPEYVRDATHQGKGRALILVGHAASEEPGMRELAKRLERTWPALPVRFVPEEPVLTTL